MKKGKRAKNSFNKKINSRSNQNKDKMKKSAMLIGIIIVIIIIAFMINNYIILDKNDRINLVINNNNITSDLKKDVIIENGVIYLSKPDVKNFFDKYIYEADDKVITTYDKKIAEIDFKENVININGSNKKINAHAREGDDGEIYLPISEMKEVYDIEIEQHEDTNIITLDSLDREQIKYMLKDNVSVKSSTNIIAKTVDKIKKGGYVIKINEAKGWTKIRTESGKIGYVKTNKLTNEVVVRENMTEEKQVSGRVNMFWDYFSEVSSAPNRNGTSIEGVNVVSPSFFYIDKNGNLQENIGDAGKEYIEWAHNNGYKVWPMVSNAGDGMINVTSGIMNSYEKRKQLIESIVEVCVKYNLDGINIDFENMKEEDKDLYSRFIIELTPRIKDIGDVISVDVTAPDGSETWSLCFDRHIIGDVANYIVFMAYDQYGISSTKPGTTAGYDWVELSLNKFLQTEEIDSNKIILAVPFYTRLWAVNENGEATSKVVMMKDVDNVLPSDVEKKWDDKLKQNYVEYQNNNLTMKMWIEDEKSLKAKLSLVSENNLGGVAQWRKGMESEGIWKLIKNEINK